MKKSIFLLFFSLIFAGQIAAQENDTELNNTPQFTHEVGINATSLIKQVISFSDTSFAISPYLITYKLLTNKNLGIRVALGGNYSRKKENVQNFEDTATSTDLGLDLRIGVEWQQQLGKRWKTAVGLDFVSSNVLDKTVIDTGFDVVTFENKSNTLGGGPILGIYYNISNKVSLYTEAAAYFTTGNSFNSQDFKSFPEFNEKSDDITETSFQFHVPTTLYLVFTF